MKDKVLNSLEFNKIKEFISNETNTFIGRKKIEELRPSTNIGEIHKLQNEALEAASLILRKFDIPLSPISDISSILKKVQIGGILSPKEVLEVADVLRISRKLKSILNDDSICLIYLKDFFENLYINKNVEDEIDRCIKSEYEIDDRASKELYNIRRKIDSLETQIKGRLNDIIHSNARFLQDDVVTFRNDRYVIPVKQEYKNEVEGLLHDYSSTGSTVFIEPKAIFDKNNEIMQLKNEERAEIERILALITQMISPLTIQISSSIDDIGIIDSIFAKARYGISIDGFIPRINTNNYINLKKARHPLIPKNDVVPIDAWLGDSFDTLVITGPNTGGKTVTLKTVGLLTIMAQCGLFIPATEDSDVAVFEDIFTDIGDEQSIEQSLSTFSAHMTNIVSILSSVSNKCLVLLDELGSGTDPVEGAALAMSILDYLHGLGAITIATTHYSELKVYAINTDGIENASCEFNVETLKPTYRLLIGLPGKSNAFAISKRLGLFDEILEKAGSYLSSEDIRFEDVIGDMEENIRSAREDREQSRQMLKEANDTKKRVEDEVKKLEEKRENILLKAKEQARDILLDAEKEANDIIKELTLIKNEENVNSRNKRAEEKRIKLKNSISDIQKDLIIPNKKVKQVVNPSEIIIGNKFYIPSLDQEVIVVSNVDKKGNVMVQSGLMKISTHISQLEAIKDDKKSSKTVVNTYIKSKAQNISPEINLIGYTVNDAIDALDKYMDDAYLSGIGRVRIVHGKGSGQLRMGIHRYLSGHPNVKSYRLGLFGEGDTGVTIVEMN